MKCGRIRRWILRNGGDELPVAWRGHVAECDACQAVLAQVRALDSALGDGEVPDPGDAYWQGFAPSVARRLDDLSRSRRPVPTTVRPSWLKTWAPALGAAALAVLIARELTIDNRPRPVLENEVPVAVQTPAVQPAEENQSPEMAITAKPADTDRDHRNQSSTTVTEQAPQSDQEAVPAGHRDEERATLSATGIPTDHGAVHGTSDVPPTTAFDETALVSPDEDASVWPDRRVTKMGEVDSDQTRQTVDAERELSDLGTPALADNQFGLSAAGAETSATVPVMGRLEAPRTYRASRVPDSQSPMDAMRRFDELRELRAQISTLSAVDPTERTPEQNRELCAIWYRMGTITDNALVLDSAIQQLGHCLQTLELPDSDEWQTKSEQLVARRALFENK